MKHHITITLAGNGTGPNNRITLDGTDVSRSIRAFTLRSEVGDIPSLVLELACLEVDVDAQNTKLAVGDEARELLVAHGWTPPEG